MTSSRHRVRAQGAVTEPRLRVPRGEMRGRPRSRDAPACVRTCEARFRLPASRNARAEHDRILECLGRSLTDVRLHGVSGVAQKRDATPTPHTARRPVVGERRFDRIGVGRLDQGGNRVKPAAVAPEELLSRALRRGTSARCTRIPFSATASRSPSRRIAAVAFAESSRPNPASRSSGALSITVGSAPARSSAIAAARPPIPAPTTTARTLAAYCDRSTAPSSLLVAAE